jgi:hypothetical protein
VTGLQLTALIAAIFTATGLHAEHDGGMVAFIIGCAIWGVLLVLVTV